MFKRFALWLCRDLVDGTTLPFGQNVWLDSDPAELNDDGIAHREHIRQQRIAALQPELDRLGIPATQSIDATRLKAGTDAVDRGQRWEMFFREEGGLADMFAAVRREAFEAAGETDANDTATIRSWAIQDRNVRKLEARVIAIVTTGKIEHQRREESARMDAIRKLKSV